MNREDAKSRAFEWSELLRRADAKEQDDIGAAEEMRLDAADIADELAQAGYDDPQALLDEKD